MRLDAATRRRLAEGALAAAETKAWKDVTIHDIAHAAGVSVAEFAPATPGDAADCVEEAFDVRLAEGVKALDAASGVRDRLFDLIMRRFEAMEVRRAGVLAIDAALERDPAALAQAHHHRVRSARWILALAGLEADGVLGAARSQGLAVILGQVRTAWRQDQAGDFARTMAALDKALRRAEETFGRFAGFEAARSADQTSAHGAS